MYSILQNSKNNKYKFMLFDDEFNMTNIRNHRWLKDRTDEIKKKGLENAWWIPVLVDEKE